MGYKLLLGDDDTMATGILFTLDARHEDKMKPVLREGVTMRPGDEYDRRLPLSYQGQQNAFRTGRSMAAIPKEADIVIVDRSDLVRTTMTAQHLLAGAGYDPDGKEGKSTIIWKPEDNRIGLANGMDFQHPELPGYKPTLPEADDYVKGMLQHFWTPQEGAEISRPVASRVAYALVDNRIRAIEELLPEVRKGATAFHLQVTHAPLIDSLDAALFGTVRVDVDGRANFNEAIFPGHYAMGMFIGGETLGAVTDNNPRLEMVGRPFLQGHREVSYTLDGLKLLRYNLQAISEERK